MIPDEAVEAAVRSMPEYTPEDEADSFDLKANEVLRGKVEMILEAAAPQLMAAAWDEGYMFSYDQERGGHGVGAIPIPEYLADDLAHWNPHRTPDA